MANERYTPEGLPIVSRKSIDSYVAEQLRWIDTGDIRCFQDFISNMESNLREKNRELYKFYKEHPPDDKNLEMGFIIGFCVLYDLLRKQAEANKLEEDLQRNK